jgi:hypothetical protein
MSGGLLDFSVAKPGFLDFGGTAGGEVDNELTISVTLARLSGSLLFMSGFRLQHTVTITASAAEPSARTFSIPLHAAQAQPIHESAPWSAGSSTPTATAVPWNDGLVQHTTIYASWEAGTESGPTITVPWNDGAVQHVAIHALWDVGALIGERSTIPWQAGKLSLRSIGLPLFSGFPVRAAWSLPWQAGQGESQAVRVCWDHGQPPRHGWRVPVLPLPTAGKIWGRLNFVCPAGGTLNFGNACFGAGRLLVPVRRSYRVINSAALIRVSDSADIPVSNITVQLDWESWCWTLSATLIGRTAYESVPAAPGLVQATINGFVWRFVVDEVDYSRAFGTFGGQLTGRSPIALLADPYSLKKSYQETSLKTAQQLMIQELPGDFSLTVTLPDWTVPANAFQYENLTPLEAILRIVQASGGRVYADKITKTVYAVPKWPRKPWNWNAAADATLSSSYSLKEQLRQQEGFEFEAVMVSGGVNSGVVLIAKRAETGGLTHAPSVVDALITHLDAAEPRAIQALADAWPMKRYTLELPLQAAPAGAGLIEPGTVLDFADGEDDGWRGLVIGVSISANWNSVQQTMEIIAP